MNLNQARPSLDQNPYQKFGRPLKSRRAKLKQFMSNLLRAISPDQSEAMSNNSLVVKLLSIVVSGGIMRIRISVHPLVALLLAVSTSASAIDVASTSAALRLANTITGGFMPTSDPLFAQMVAKVADGDVEGAASIAANSKYAASYLARRMAFQMQNPSLDASVVTDSDATAFVMAHFIGTKATKPSISSLWSENATYLVDTGGAAPVHAATLNAAQLSSIDWTTALVQQPGQSAQVSTNGVLAPGPIPAKHVGGYVTLSDRTNDNSFAMYGALDGTNLRFIEGIWQISTGLSLLDVASPSALAQDVPRFIPEYDPNFFHGQGQTACIACHGGGMPSLVHGYATVADVFDFDSGKGFTYYATQTTNTRKSLGSDAGKRNTILTCNLTRTPTAVCNPDSTGVDPNNAWDVSKTWQATGVLAAMGWTGPTSGQGLNELGTAIGKAGIVYENMVKRVVNEICPMGIFQTPQISAIAKTVNPYAPVPGTDDIRTIVAKVAADPSCQ